MAKRRKKRKKARTPFAIRAARFQTQSSVIYEWLLRFSMILFLFHVFYEDINTDNIEFTGSMFIDGMFNVIRLFLFLALIIVILSLGRTSLRFVTYFLILLGSIFKIIFTLFDTGFNTSIFVYVLLIVIVSYYLPKYRDGLKRAT